MRPLGLLARRPAFARLWLAGALSLVGDWLSLVAVSVLAAERGGGPLALAGILAAHALPGAIVSPIAGVLADRFDRRRLLVATALIQALLTALMAVAAGRGEVLAVQALLVLRSALSAMVPPAEAGALRHVVDEGELLPANVLLASTWSVAYVLGMALGGLLATLGPEAAISLDAVSFVACAALVVTLPRMPPPRRSHPPVAESRPPVYGPRAAARALVADWRAALGEAARRPRLLRAALAKAPVALGGGAAWLALNLAASEARPFGAAALSLGILQAVRGAGTGLGPAVAARLAGRGLRRAHLAAASYALAFGGMAALPFVSSPAALLGAALAWGTGTGSSWVLSQTALQRHAGDAFIGRLAALDELAFSFAMCATAGASAALQAAGASRAAATLAMVGVGVAAWWALAARTSRALARHSAGASDGAPRAAGSSDANTTQKVTNAAQSAAR